MSSSLKVPKLGRAAGMLEELNAEHAQPPQNPDENITRNAEINIPAHITANASNSEDSGAARSVAAQEDAREGAKAGALPASRPDAKKAARKDAKAAALERVQDLGRSAPVPITLRLAERLNDEVDEIAHRHRKARVKKQDLITLALQMLVAELDAGADLGELLDAYQGRGAR